MSKKMVHVKCVRNPNKYNPPTIANNPISLFVVNFSLNSIFEYSVVNNIGNAYVYVTLFVNVLQLFVAKTNKHGSTQLLWKNPLKSLLNACSFSFFL